MKLKNIQIFPSGSHGWGTEALSFGDHITQLLGPNGCGKTPVVQSIAFCLGYPSVFRNDIYERCLHAVLEVESKQGDLRIKRVYSRDVDIEVSLPDKTSQRFFNEEEFSSFLFEWLEITVSNLVSNGNKITKPYIATILPLFYVDQDNGYSGIYVPKSNFIKDQFSEMMRMVFRLPVKNSFDAKKFRIKAKEKLDSLDKTVNDKSKLVELAKETVSTHPMKAGEISEEINRLEVEIENLRGQGSVRDDSVSALDNLISRHNRRLQEMERELQDVRRRRSGIETIVSEINSEINALSLNEEARRVFLSFNEICARKDCQLFATSADAYAKNLLYLKDQLKDLQRNDVSDEKTEIRTIQEVETLTKVILGIVDERNSTVEKSEISSIVSAVSEMKNEVFRLQSMLNEIENYEKLQNEYISASNRRNEALGQYEAFSSSSTLVPEIVRLRADLRQSFLDWMDGLHTSNVSRDITFTNDFMPVLGKESISQLKGSTKVRTILAFHASLLELSANSNSAFNFLILDTPKQHEIHNDDLDKYFHSVKGLCTRYHVQIIFSSTEYEYSGVLNSVQN